MVIEECWSLVRLRVLALSMVCLTDGPAVSVLEEASSSASPPDTLVMNANVR